MQLVSRIPWQFLFGKSLFLACLDDIIGQFEEGKFRSAFCLDL